MKQTTTHLVLALLLLPLTSCAALGLSGAGSSIPDVKPPNVRISAVRMADMPTARDLASYYCSQYLGPLICKAFGSVPQISDIHFAFDVELLWLARRHRLQIAEIPVVWRHANESKVSPGVDAARMFADLLRIRALHWFDH